MQVRCGYLRTTKLWVILPIYNLPLILSHFLLRDFNSVIMEVIGCCISRGAGYGLKVQCVYWLHGSKIYVCRKLEKLSVYMFVCLFVSVVIYGGMYTSASNIVAIMIIYNYANRFC